MDSRRYRWQIILIVFLVIAISVILFMISYNLFSDRQTKRNTTIETMAEKNVLSGSERYKDERIYHVVYDSADERSVTEKERCKKMLDELKVRYAVSRIANLKPIDVNDYIILTAGDWANHKTSIDRIFENVSKGASLLMTYLPGDDGLFSAYAPRMGIYEVSSGTRVSEKVVVKDDMMLGLKAGDVLDTELVWTEHYDIHINDNATVYLTDDSDIPIYFTVPYGQGIIGAYNGNRIGERAVNGMFTGMLGTLDDGLIYPIVNAGVFFLDDWPAPFNFIEPDIYEQYGLNFDDFLQYVWWPDMLALIKRHDIQFTATMVLSYNDVQQPPFNVTQSVLNSPMYVHYQQVIENGGEICMHGYNHEPLWFKNYLDRELVGAYKPWPKEAYAIEAMAFAISEFQKAFPEYEMYCYVPPSNIIDDTGKAVIEKTIGPPVILSGIYHGSPPQEPSFDFEVDDGTICFPRITSGSKFSDGIKFHIAAGMTQYGVFSHFVHPDDVIDDERSYGMTWEEMRREYDRMFDYMDERYPYLTYHTISESAKRLINWCNMDYSVSYLPDIIKVKTKTDADEYYLILRSNRAIDGGEGYTVMQMDERTYFITATQPEIIINLEGEG